MNAEEHWEFYRKACYSGKEITKTQHDEVKQGFMSGALSVLSAVSMAAEELPEDVAADYVRNLTQDLIDYCQKRSDQMLAGSGNN